MKTRESPEPFVTERSLHFLWFSIPPTVVDVDQDGVSELLLAVVEGEEYSTETAVIFRAGDNQIEETPLLVDGIQVEFKCRYSDESDWELEDGWPRRLSMEFTAIASERFYSNSMMGTGISPRIW